MYQNKMEQKIPFRIYTENPLPQFIWVAEISVKSLYEEDASVCMGEIILDASGNEFEGTNVILVNYPEKIVAKLPDEDYARFHFKFTQTEVNQAFFLCHAFSNLK